MKGAIYSSVNDHVILLTAIFLSLNMVSSHMPYLVGCPTHKWPSLALSGSRGLHSCKMVPENERRS